MPKCFPLPLGTMLLVSLDFPQGQFFQNWNWGKEGWEQGTGNYNVYPDITGTSEMLIWLLTLYFVRVLQIFCQYLRHKYLSMIVHLDSQNFSSTIIHSKYVFLSPLVYFGSLVVHSISHNIRRRSCNSILFEKCSHHGLSENWNKLITGFTKNSTHKTC